MKLYSVFALATLCLSAMSSTESDLPAKGSCFLDGTRIPMKRILNQPVTPYKGTLAWQAQLTTQLTAEVRFTPGFNMTNLTLELHRQSDSIAQSKMWVASDLSPDDKQPASSESKDHLFDSIGLEIMVPEGRICCEYNLYLDSPDTDSFYCGKFRTFHRTDVSHIASSKQAR